MRLHCFSHLAAQFLPKFQLKVTYQWPPSEEDVSPSPPLSLPLTKFVLGAHMCHLVKMVSFLPDCTEMYLKMTLECSKLGMNRHCLILNHAAAAVFSQNFLAAIAQTFTFPKLSSVWTSTKLLHHCS